MSTGPTPGPWQAGEPVCSEGRLVYIAIFGQQKRIASTSVYGCRSDDTQAGEQYVDRFGIERTKPVISGTECAANARLIAAAPDLLAALQALIGNDGSAGRIGPLHKAAQSKNPGIAGEAQRLIDRARAAIDKARRTE